METWDPDPSQILPHESGIEHREVGAHSIPRLSSAKFAAHSLGCAETGRKGRIENVMVRQAPIVVAFVRT